MSSKDTALYDKGGLAEECLRQYFLQLGAYVLRGAKVRAGRDIVTDIDLWVYTRSSVHARNISIVDIKNKKKAKPYERLIWIKGLQFAVKADDAIVATSSSKEYVKSFAQKLDLKVLSATTVKAIIDRYSKDNDRLSSEELDVLWRTIKIENNVLLSSRMESNIIEVGLGLTFQALNIWIDEAKKLLIYCHDHERNPGPVMRAILLCASLIAIAADFLGREVAFDDQTSRQQFFRDGLLFGDTPSSSNFMKYIHFAEQLTTDYIDKSGATAAKIRSSFKREVENLPVAAFADYFSRPYGGRELMEAAIQLEAAAFSRSLKTFAALPPEAKIIIALLIDYSGLDRRRMIGHEPNPIAAAINSDKELTKDKDASALAMKNLERGQLL